MSTDNCPSFKVVLVGDGGVGKSTLVKRLLTGEFEKVYRATMGVEVTPLMFHTSAGPVMLKIWDCAGQEKFGGLRDGYYILADAAIIAFDVTSRITFKNVHNWREDLARVTVGNSPTPAFQPTTPSAASWLGIPSVLIGCKAEIKDRYVTAKHISGTIDRFRGPNFAYFDISAKSNYNFEKPFLFLIRQLLSNPDLFFIGSPQDSLSREGLSREGLPSPSPTALPSPAHPDIELPPDIEEDSVSYFASSAPSPQPLITDPSLQAALPRLSPSLHQVLSEKQQDPAVRSIVEVYLFDNDLDDLVDSLQTLLSL